MDVDRRKRDGEMTLRTLAFAMLVVGAAMAGSATYAQAPDRARLDAAKEMMEVSGASKQFDEAVPLMFDQLARSFAQIAPGKGKEIREVFDQITPRFLQRKHELIDQIAALYAAEMSLDDLNAVIAFYRSQVGLRFASMQPKIMRESMVLGQRWGERLGSELQDEARRELRRRGINM
jgi:hypothetical protein